MLNELTPRIATGANTVIAAALIGVVAALGGMPGTAHADSWVNTTPAVPPAAGPVYGDPVAAAQYWREQHFDDCSLMAVADVVGQLTGTEPSEQAILTVAQHTPSKVHPGPIYAPPRNPGDPSSGQGTATEDEVALLEYYGIHGVLTDRPHASGTGVDTGVAALQQHLAAGRKVIAGVNGETIWQRSDGNRVRNDHAVVVTGIDTKAKLVHLNDSGTPDGRDEQVPIATFTKAWDTGDDEMVVTQETGNSTPPLGHSTGSHTTP